MSNWEKIIKDKLDNSARPLPESLHDEFLSRLDTSDKPNVSATPVKKRHPILWALAPAAAAALAAVLLLRQPSAPESAVQVVRQDTTPVAAAPVPIEPVQSSEPAVPTNPAATVRTPRPEPRTIIPNIEILQPGSSADDTESIAFAEPAEGTKEADTSDEAADIFIPEPIQTVSPYKTEVYTSRLTTMKVAPAAGIVAGGGLLAAFLRPIIESGGQKTILTLLPDYIFRGRYASGFPDMSDRPLGGQKHHSALFKGGLSIGIPVAKRLKITTGLEYSEYRSSFTWQFKTGAMMVEVGEKEQLVQYLGVPLRLDWSLAKNNWLDVYVGAGAQADYCIGATLTDMRIGKQRKSETLERDGFVFSLLGAGGIQVNVNKRIGLYLEPELVWTGGKPSTAEERVYPEGWYGYEIPAEESTGLQTYRTEHPFMFSISTGLRINLGK